MKNLILFSIFLLCSLSGNTDIKAQSVFALIESSGGCDLSTNCDSNRICLDIVLTPGVSAVALSYNLWLNYQGTSLSYASDNACITDNGNDNNFNSLGHYRVAGVNGTTNVSQGVPVSLHTICFTYPDIDDINNDVITVGGTVFQTAHSTITYNNPPSSETPLPEFPFVISSATISCALLPVKWLSFEAVKVGKTAELIWSTAEEFQLSHYEIQHSLDGRTFKPIGVVQPDLGLQQIHKYAFTDLNPMAGTNYYRIKQWDQDGRFEYSHVRSLFFDERGVAWTVSPNPTSNIFYLSTPYNWEGPVNVRIVNAVGQLVLINSWEEFNERAEVDAINLAPGTYSIIIDSQGEVFTDKLVIIK